MLYGKCQEKNNKKIEAFRNYMDALYLAEKNDNKRLIFDVYGNLSLFFQLLSQHEKAEYYKRKQYELASGTDRVDSVQLMMLTMKLSEILFNNAKATNAEVLVKETLRFSIEKNLYELTELQLNVYRSYLIEHGNL